MMSTTESAVEPMARPRPVRVMLIEDYKLVRLGLVSVLRNDPELSVIGESENAEDGLRLMERHKPDVVLMDLGLPGMNGIQATKLVKERFPDTKVIILTSHENEEEVLASLSAGANAYCLKDIPSERLIEIVKYVFDGAAWLDPGIAQIALKAFNFPLNELREDAEDGSTMMDKLTNREQEVLRLLVEGKSNSEIADVLCVSVHTIKVQVSNILQKLAVNDRVQAAVKAVKSGMV